MEPVHVAVGVIVDEAGRILITRRAASTHQGGLWEFPGGKVEPGESVQEALARELYEELGIRIGPAAIPLLEIQHSYADKAVLLDVWVVSEFSGCAQGREGQPLAWVVPSEFDSYDFPAANVSIIEAVKKRYPGDIAP
jgi:8-oxo-dGTP diphosphatase